MRSKLKVTRRLGYPVPITRIKIIAGIEEWGKKQCYVPTNNGDYGNSDHNVGGGGGGGGGGVTMPMHCLTKTFLVTNTSFFLL